MDCLRHRILALFVVGCITLTLSSVQTSARQTQPGASPAASSARAVFDKYCITCHNQKLHTAGLELDSLDTANPVAHAEVLEKVIAKLRVALERELDRTWEANPNPGRIGAVHRLNRAEYNNAIRDLLAIDLDVKPLLPGDETADGSFDNFADALSISTAHLERYMSVARQVTRLATGLPPANPALETFEIPLHVIQDDRQSEDLPLGSRGGIAIRHDFPVNGEYLIKVRLQRQYQDYIKGMGWSQQLDVRLDGTLLKRFTVGGKAEGRPAAASYAGDGEPGFAGDDSWEKYMQIGGDAGLEIRVPVEAGPHVIAASFVRELWEPEGLPQPLQRGRVITNDQVYMDYANVGKLQIGGPYKNSGPATDTPSRRAIFVCQPKVAAEERACAAKILSKMARLAYRRPVTSRDVQTLAEFFDTGRQDGGSLSFFLWSSIPDDRLLSLAEKGQLSDPVILEKEVRRMLADPRAITALVDDFAAQWLNLRRVQEVVVDPERYPNYDLSLMQGFQQETEMFVASTIREDRSIVDLLNADYTFVNERLARHYGIPGIYGSRFRRVTLPNHDQRGGLLAEGALLATTSYPDRTSPVLRGKWLLNNIFGLPIPPPPPGVDTNLADNKPGAAPKSIRERLAQHRSSASCNGCHSVIDPLGFALENFDVIGGWRSVDESGKPVDASGSTLGGAKVEGLSGLRSLLLDQPEQFPRTVTEKLLAYALGRRIEYYDEPAVRKIVRDAAAQNYRWSSIIVGIVKSPTFLMRTHS